MNTAVGRTERQNIRQSSGSKTDTTDKETRTEKIKDRRVQSL